MTRESGPLATKLRMLAQTRGMATAEERALCIQHADELDAVIDAMPTTGEAELKKVLGAWARARRLYCDITGEPLI